MRLGHTLQLSISSSPSRVSFHISSVRFSTSLAMYPRKTHPSARYMAKPAPIRTGKSPGTFRVASLGVAGSITRETVPERMGIESHESDPGFWIFAVASAISSALRSEIVSISAPGCCALLSILAVVGLSYLEVGCGLRRPG